MSEYIAFNTQMRAATTNSFTKDFYKLAINSVFGYTMMNPRKFINIYLITDPKSMLKLTRKSNFKGCNIINSNLVAVEMKRETLTLLQPIYVGFTILELSKLLLFTDTDSLTYEIKTTDIYEDLSNHTDLFDTSDYPKNINFIVKRIRKFWEN